MGIMPWYIATYGLDVKPSPDPGGQREDRADDHDAFNEDAKPGDLRLQKL